MIQRAAANGLPAALQDPSHQFRADLVQLLAQYLYPAASPTAFSADEEAVLANTNIVFTTVRVSHQVLPVWAYDCNAERHTLVELQGDKT